MASLTIIPYNPIQANRPRAKDVFKPINDYDRELRTKPSILPVDTPQPQAVADGAGGLTMREKDSDSQKPTAPIIMGGSEKVSSAGEGGSLIGPE